MQETDVRYAAKLPVQQRSQERFNNILLAAEELVLEIGIDEVSHHKIAKRACIPPASVYQYFPTMGILFATMAEIHFDEAFDLITAAIANKRIRHWRDLITTFINVAYDFYDHDQINRALFLGIHLTPEVRESTAERLTRFAIWFTEKFALFYKESDLEPLVEKIAIAIEVMRGVYVRNLSLHGELKPEYKQEVTILITQYFDVFFAQIEN